MRKRKILDFIETLNGSSQYHSCDISETYSFLGNNDTFHKTQPIKKKNLEKYEEKKTIFRNFFLKFHIKFYESLLEIEKNETIGVIGIIENIHTYSKEAVKANNLSLLVGTHKFPCCDCLNHEGNEEISSENKIFFKDNSAKIEIIVDETKVKWLTTESEIKTANFNKKLLINGLIIALIGETTDYQRFFVNTIIFEGISPNKIKNHDINNKISQISFEINTLKTSKYVVFISDIEILHDKSIESLLLFEEFITTGIFSLNILRIIIVGNVFGNFQSLQNAMQSTTKCKQMYQNAYFSIDFALNKFKAFIDSIRKKNEFVSIDVIFDANEEKYREILLDLLAKDYEKSPHLKNENKNVNFFQNPYFFQINDVRFLGATGENLKELGYYCQFHRENHINLMEYICFWGNLWPFNIMNRNHEIEKNTNNFPHVYFQGGGEKYNSKVFYEENSEAFCQLISIPSFSKTKSCVVFDLLNFNCFETSFT